MPFTEEELHELTHRTNHWDEVDPPLTYVEITEWDKRTGVKIRTVGDFMQIVNKFAEVNETDPMSVEMELTIERHYGGDEGRINLTVRG